jgi:conjugal transfer ATP-binding protein TraC
MMFFKKKQNNKKDNKKKGKLSISRGAISESEKIYQKGIATVKDIIAPAALKINSNYLQVGEKFVKTLFVFTYPRYLQTSWLSPIINFDTAFDMSMFVHPLESPTVLKNLKKTVTQIESQISINEEKNKVRDPVLETALQDAEELRDRLMQGSERLFQFGLYITFFAESLKELDEISSQIEGMLETRLVYAKPALFQMEQGFASTLPLGNDELMIGNNMNSSPLSTTFPFVSSDLTSNQGILYGINRHNNSLILFDRFSLENANMVILGKSGGGKSYAVKLEILRSLMLGTDVLIIDPENEYKHLAETVGGSFIKISLTSKYHLNPFDLPTPLEDETVADILRSHIAGLIGLVKVMLGSLTPEEDSILDKALTETYALKDITPESNLKKITPPTMQDLQTILDNMDGAENLSLRLRKYTEGIFSGFLNNPTNVNADNNLVVFNIRDMEEELRPVAMYVILNYIWTLVRSRLKKRILILDEAWWLMQHEEGAAFTFGIAKRARKYYLGLTTITQDITDFFSSRYGKPIVTNSSLLLLMKQSPAAIDIVSDTFYLTNEERFLLLESNVGEGIFFAGLKRAAIKIIASYSEDQIVTTDPAQLLEIKKAKKELARE